MKKRIERGAVFGMVVALFGAAPSAAEDVAVAPDVAAKLEAVVRTWHEAGRFDGAVLVNTGAGVWTGSAGQAVREWGIPNSPDTRYPIASLTKQFTAVLVMRLVERGELDLDGVITDYLPAFRADPGRRITVRDLLSHTSGLPEMDDDLYADVHPEAGNGRALVEEYAQGDLTFEPATDFAYTNTDYHVLGAILEAITGRSFEDLLTDEVLTPLGMMNSGIARRDAVLPNRALDYAPADDGWRRAPPYAWENWHAAGAMYATVGDLHLWNRALTEGTLLRDDTWETMLTPRTDVGSTGNYVALGSWVYPRALPGSDLSPVLVERRGAIGGYAALNVIVKGENRWIVILANAYNLQIHQLPWGSSMPLDLLLVTYGLEPLGP